MPTDLETLHRVYLPEFQVQWKFTQRKLHVLEDFEANDNSIEKSGQTNYDDSWNIKKKLLSTYLTSSRTYIVLH